MVNENDAGFNRNNNSCVFRSTLNITKLYLYSIAYKDVPKCIPPTTTSLSLVGVPLTDFNTQNGSENVRPDTIWPSKLRTLYIKRAEMSSIGVHVFRNAPATLQKIILGTCEHPLGRMPSHWPVTLKYMWVMNCGINEVRTEDLSNLTRIKNINLRGNLLTSLPDRFPSSLVSLDLTSNKITQVDNVRWDLLPNMTTIDFSQNKLVSVPLNLPSTIQNLNLRYNKIDFCDRNAFRHMTQLYNLDLGYNK